MTTEEILAISKERWPWRPASFHDGLAKNVAFRGVTGDQNAFFDAYGKAFEMAEQRWPGRTAEIHHQYAIELADRAGRGIQ